MKKVVPFKNYLLLFIIAFVSVYLTFYITDKYKQQLDNNKEKSIIFDVLYQVKIEELNNYLLENPNIVVYLHCDSLNEDFEREFHKYIINNNLKNSVIIIDATNLENIEILENLYTKKIIKQNNILIIEDRKVSDVMYDKNNSIDVTNIDIFLKEYGILND